MSGGLQGSVQPSINPSGSTGNGGAPLPFRISIILRITSGIQTASSACSCVRAFIAATSPRQLLDVGCNTGEFAALALRSGAQAVIGLEADGAAANLAFQDPRVLDIFRPLPSATDLAAALDWPASAPQAPSAEAAGS